jgi:hypothetical protein
MPLARLAQYQHCLLRRNWVRTNWSGAQTEGPTLRHQLEQLPTQWGSDAPMPWANHRLPSVI